MNEVFYNFKLTIGFLIISLFVAYWNLKLEQMTKMQTIGFITLREEFEVEVSNNYTSRNTIYLNPGSPCLDSDWDISNGITATVPDKCISRNDKKSVKCLNDIRKRAYWYIDWKYFIPSFEYMYYNIDNHKWQDNKPAWVEWTNYRKVQCMTKVWKDFYEHQQEIHN